MTARAGFFISLEGVDGAGKSTQVASLAAWLRTVRPDVIAVRPDDTPLGELVRSFVLQHQTGAPIDPWAEALLFFAGRAQLLRERIIPGLQRGAIVIADRFTDSTLAYQGGGRGLPIDELMRLHDTVCEGVWPDLTIYLDVPLSVAGSRQHAQQLPLDRFEVAPEDFHALVRQAFEDLADRFPDRIVRVDAARPALAVSREISEIVQRRLENASVFATAGTAGA